MTTLSIREHGAATANPVVVIGGHEHPFQLPTPFTPAEEQRLEWYFEQRFKLPFTHRVKAAHAASSIRIYGERLFAAVFAGEAARAAWYAQRQATGDLLVEIVGSPAFQRLHWEALQDPTADRPLALQGAFVRRHRASPPPVTAAPQAPAAARVLLLTARPREARDVGYRTIARPLLGAIAAANLPVQVELLRPGTFDALVHHLDAARLEYGPGCYQVIHFDVHGAQLPYRLARLHRKDLAPYPGVETFLFLEGPGRTVRLVTAAEVANLVAAHAIPIVILNACQSAKAHGQAEETSFGSRLMALGVDTVLAMGYSITVSAAQLLMQTFYRDLFRGVPLAEALHHTRMALYNDKRRAAYYREEIELEDWLLPVLFENRPHLFPSMSVSTLPLAAPGAACTGPSGRAVSAALAKSSDEPPTTYRFVGRDLDILTIERDLINGSNILLLRGMGGTGKTTLLRHLAWWWQRTGFVGEVFSYGYDQRAWTRRQIMDDLGRRLLGAQNYQRDVQPLGPDAQAALLAERLRAARHLLILDNLESITGSELAIPHTLSPAEQMHLHHFLQSLAGGATLVLLGSRSGEDWLAGGTFGANVHHLGGLDEEAASELADLVLTRHGATVHRRDPVLAQLLKLLGGHPLALEVVLANLAHQTPAEVLAALTSGAPGLDAAEFDLNTPDIYKKTESIVACIAYSHSNLSPAAQQLLLCLAPFTGIIDLDQLPKYTVLLQAQPATASLPFDQWETVLETAAAWGLLAEHPEVNHALQPQPILPYFLRSRLHDEPAWQEAVHTAFRLHYSTYATALSALLKSNRAEQRQLGMLLTAGEYENLHAALSLALNALQDFYTVFDVLFRYLGFQKDYRRTLELSTTVLGYRSSYPHDYAERFLVVMDCASASYIDLQNPDAAAHICQEELAFLAELTSIAAEQRTKYTASIYHQLGRAAEEKRQWVQAEDSYREALAAFAVVGDRYSQGRTYHQLGVVTQFQHRWGQAEQYYRQALAIFVEFQDHYSQATTYHQLGRVAQQQRQWEQSEQYYRQALAIKLEFVDRPAQARTYHQLGLVAEEQRKWRQAAQYYQDALAIFIECNDQRTQASTYHQLGRVAQKQQQWLQAQQYYEQALAIYGDMDDHYEMGSVYHQLGVVAQEQRQWDHAEEYYQKALAISVASADRHSQASTYHNLGTLAQERRNWNQAEEYYHNVLDILTEFNNVYGQALTYHQLGMVAQEQQRWMQAEQHYLHALAIKVEYNDRYSQACTYHQLGVLAEDQQQWDLAEQHYRQALNLFAEFDDEHDRACTHQQLGRVALQQQQPAEAYHHFLTALRIFQNEEDDSRLQITLQILALIWHSTGDESVLTAAAEVCGITPSDMAARFRNLTQNS